MSKKQKQELVKKLKLADVKIICECALNIVKQKVPLHDATLKKLGQSKAFSDLIVQLADKKVSLVKQKEKLATQTGKGFPLMLFAPILTGLVSRLADKFIK